MRNISFFMYFMSCMFAFAGNDIPSYKGRQSSDLFFKGKTEEQILDDCVNNQSTLVVNFCEKRKFEMASRKLKVLFSIQLKATKKNDISLRGNGLPAASAYFISSQISWLKYRDDTCVFEYLYSGSGTIRGVEYFSCLLKMTNRRIEELSDESSE